MDDELAKNFGDHRQLTGIIYVAKLTDAPNKLVHYKHLNCAEETVDINLGDHNFKEFL